MNIRLKFVKCLRSAMALDDTNEKEKRHTHKQQSRYTRQTKKAFGLGKESCIYSRRHITAILIFSLSTRRHILAKARKISNDIFFFGAEKKNSEMKTIFLCYLVGIQMTMKLVAKCKHAEMNAFAMGRSTNVLLAHRMQSSGGRRRCHHRS